MNLTMGLRISNWSEDLIISNPNTNSDGSRLLESGEISDYVFLLSRTYRKSLSLQNLPITIIYPEMVAEKFPYFTYDKVSDHVN